jgi:hypothetical protein
MFRARHEFDATLSKVAKDEIPVEMLNLHVPTQEWRAIVTIRPNVLVEGSDFSTEKVISAVTAAVSGSVCEWDTHVREKEPAATMIVRRVDLLDAEEHRRLLDFLNVESAGTRVRQVIATSARPLYALVESGLFLPDLYYRLNTIRLELDDTSPKDLD